MEKYMGNKSKLVRFIYDSIENSITTQNRVLFDAFSGTTNVGKYFKQKGYSIIANDINDFTYIFERCYIVNSNIPKFKKLLESTFYSSLNYKRVINTDSFRNNKKQLLSENKNLLESDFISKIINTDYLNLLVYLSYYCTSADYDNNTDNGITKKGLNNFLQRNYCEGGTNSKYINQVYINSINKIEKLLNIYDTDKVEYIKKFKSTYDIKYLELLHQTLDNEKDIKETLSKLLSKNNIVGERKFFSLEHANKLDTIINTVCYWKNNNLLEESEYDVLITAIIETIAIFSNTSATYQAFYKEYKANTMQQFRLLVPVLTTNLGENTYVALKGDIFENINSCKYDILYLDPPYNWRQYDSNYHLLNTIAKLNDIADISEFEKGIVGASGENRKHKLKYTSLNQKSTFEDRLISLIKAAKCSLVVLSYSDSASNHRTEDINDTLNRLETFFKEDECFIKGSYQKLEYKRQNFESRRQNKKQEVKELLYIVEKKDGVY